MLRYTKNDLHDRPSTSQRAGAERHGLPPEVDTGSKDSHRPGTLRNSNVVEVMVPDSDDEIRRPVAGGGVPLSVYDCQAMTLMKTAVERKTMNRDLRFCCLARMRLEIFQ